MPGVSEVQLSAVPDATDAIVRACDPADQLDVTNARAACQSLELLGRFAGIATSVLGMIAGSLSVLEGTAQHPSPAGWAAMIVRAGLWTAGCGLAGWTVAVLSRAAAAIAIAYLDRVNHNAEHLNSQAVQAVALLERITRVVEERRTIAADTERYPKKVQARAEIEQATRGAAWEHADLLLNRFAADYPDDAAIPGLRAALEAARQHAVEEHLAQLDAARKVGDPDRVLEIYEAAARLVPSDARTMLDGDIAPWFLALIHRRLRQGKIQPDVVRLAERFSETFSTTVEGASVRASLSTLRRSVGLCPRCSRPYVGVAEACPRCLAGVAGAPEPAVPDLTLTPPG